MISQIVKPLNTFDPRLDGPNIFAATFKKQTPDEWCGTLTRSIEDRFINDIEFPAFPPPELQTRIHGHSGAHSIREACDYYKFILSLGLIKTDINQNEEKYFLDFGCGWGRITRLFMRDFELRCMIGYEPCGRFCAVARALNPFVAFIHGTHMPTEVLPPKKFNLIVGWSVFSHLSRNCAGAWLKEFSRVLRPGGFAVMTTWGSRFISRLISEQELLRSGHDINWYSKICIEGSDNLFEQMDKYKKGEFVWFKSGSSDLYGEAFISPDALQKLLRDYAPELSVHHFDSTSLAQDVFVLRRIES